MLQNKKIITDIGNNDIKFVVYHNVSSKVVIDDIFTTPNTAFRDPRATSSNILAVIKANKLPKNIGIILNSSILLHKMEQSALTKDADIKGFVKSTMIDDIKGSIKVEDLVYDYFATGQVFLNAQSKNIIYVYAYPKYIVSRYCKELADCGIKVNFIDSCFTGYREYIKKVINPAYDADFMWADIGKSSARQMSFKGDILVNQVKTDNGIDELLHRFVHKHNVGLTSITDIINQIGVIACEEDDEKIFSILGMGFAEYNSIMEDYTNKIYLDIKNNYDNNRYEGNTRVPLMVSGYGATIPGMFRILSDKVSQFSKVSIWGLSESFREKNLENKSGRAITSEYATSVVATLR